MPVFIASNSGNQDGSGTFSGFLRDELREVSHGYCYENFTVKSRETKSAG
jgi:hypothetical protein